MDERINNEDKLNDDTIVKVDEAGDNEIVSYETDQSNISLNNSEEDLSSTNSVTNSKEDLTSNDTSEEMVDVNKTVEKKLSVKTDGSIFIDNKLATNEELESYLDYTKYSDKKTARLVEMMLKNDKININGVIFEAKLTEDGQLVSIDGTKKYNQEEILKYLGKKVYVALLCKTVKNVSVNEDGTIRINDKDEIINIKLSSQINDVFMYNQSEIDLRKEKKLEESIINEVVPTASSPNGLYNSYIGGYPSSGYSGYSGKTGTTKQGTVADSCSTIIKVEFGKLTSISEEMSSLSKELSGVCDDYKDTITSLANNNSAWEGIDKDVYIDQKQGYSTNFGDISKTLGEFAKYLNECVEDYTKLENELSNLSID